MPRTPHTTKSGPGRRHVEGTYRGTKLVGKDKLPREYPGAKLDRMAINVSLTKRG